MRKDNTFFFVDYQGTITRSTGTARAGVASAAERQGDFSELCVRAGGTFDSAGRCSAAAGQLWDPMTGTYSSSVGGAVRSQFIPFNNLATYTSPGNPNLAGTVFQLPNRPGNLIDPVAFKMMQYFPVPNVAVGTPSYNPLNNWIGANGSRSNDHRFDIKIDQRLKDAGVLSGRFSRSRSESEGVNCFGNIADPCTQGPNSGHSYSSSLNFNRTFGPTLVLNVAYGFARSYSYTAGVATDFKDFNPVTTLGLPPYILTSGYLATPNVTLGNGYQAVSAQALGSQTFSILKYPLDTHNLNANLDKIKGQHEFKFGWEGRMHRISFLQISYPDGQFNFTQAGTSQTPASGTGGDPGNHPRPEVPPALPRGFVLVRAALSGGAAPVAHGGVGRAVRGGADVCAGDAAEEDGQVFVVHVAVGRSIQVGPRAGAGHADGRSGETPLQEGEVGLIHVAVAVEVGPHTLHDKRDRECFRAVARFGGGDRDREGQSDPEANHHRDLHIGIGGAGRIQRPDSSFRGSAKR